MQNEVCHVHLFKHTITCYPSQKGLTTNMNMSYNIRRDLPSVVNSKIRLFGDDCLIYVEIKTINDQNDLQKDLIICKSGPLSCRI